ncbi:MAG: ferritin-like domain-containing protein [Acidimicrobiales bacterium]
MHGNRPLSGGGFNRRRFLAGAAAAGGVALVASACGNDDDGGDSGAGQAGGPTTAANAAADLDVAVAAAGLEKLAFDTYTAAGNAATAGKLGTVPPAVATFVTTAAKQHQEALDRWNQVLTAGGRQAVAAPAASLAPTVNAEFAKVTDVAGAATLALRLEDYASQTYQSVIPKLQSADAVKLAAQVNVVGQQRQAILRYVLGLYPVGSGPVKGTTNPAPVDFAPSNPQPSLITG